VVATTVASAVDGEFSVTADREPRERDVSAARHCTQKTAAGISSITASSHSRTVTMPFNRNPLPCASPPPLANLHERPETDRTDHSTAASLRSTPGLAITPARRIGRRRRGRGPKRNMASPRRTDRFTARLPMRPQILAFSWPISFPILTVRGSAHVDDNSIG
jgi:hypothetical protein